MSKFKKLCKESVVTTKLFWKEAWKRAVDVRHGDLEVTNAYFPVYGRYGEEMPLRVYIVPEFSDGKITLTYSQFTEKVTLSSITDIEKVIEDPQAYLDSGSDVEDLAYYANENMDSDETEIMDNDLVDDEDMDEVLDDAVNMICEVIDDACGETSRYFESSLDNIQNELDDLIQNYSMESFNRKCESKDLMNNEIIEAESEEEFEKLIKNMKRSAKTEAKSTCIFVGRLKDNPVKETSGLASFVVVSEMNGSVKEYKVKSTRKQADVIMNHLRKNSLVCVEATGTRVFSAERITFFSSKNLKKESKKSRIVYQERSNH